ncbi:MAG: methyltransferase domain-containing protein [Acidobacteriota bacterium]|nr:methyltransferase domain-containing protein [Acidobacteriota bacterium]
MTQTPTDLKRADYGIDAPGVQLRFLIIGASCVAAGVVLILVGRARHVGFARSVAAPLLSIGVTFLLTAGVMFWGSRVGKLRLRDKVIDKLNLRGDERVLDVGCGHGLMLCAAAKRLGSGRAVGVDIWQKEDQAGNSPDATLANARAEGVADRVEIRDGDARSLPFPDATFDAAVSSWALHNIYDETDRARAVREIARVVKPGGRLAIIDIRHAADYARTLEECGMEGVRLHAPSFIFLIPSRLLTATKPAAR